MDDRRTGGDLELTAFVKAYPEPEAATDLANNTATLKLSNATQGGGGGSGGSGGGGGGTSAQPAKVLKGTSVAGSPLPGGTLRATRPSWNRAPGPSPSSGSFATARAVRRFCARPA